MIMKSIHFPSPVADDMVRAILEGRKTVTRRVVKEPWYIEDEEMSRVSGFAMHRGCNCTLGMPYPDSLYRLSDTLYVRETFCRQPSEEYPFVYKASVETLDAWQWCPSIHMPREAARIFLRVTDVRVERLWDITEEQAEREGCTAGHIEIAGGPWGVEDDPDEWTARESFADVWDSTIKKADQALYSWDANPWVWVIEFERISREEARQCL